MKNRKTAYQRVLLDDTWYVIIKEEEFKTLTQTPKPNSKADILDVMNISDQRLADRLLQRRQDAKLTQKDLAKLANLRVETLSRIEKGRTAPDFKTIRKLVNAINEYNETKTGDETCQHKPPKQ
ncbi:MAG: helix-turn-helix domain-containing protein [Phycisphaerae bacterium]|nr:helix-turn-helix domain-containing protein [Phycisphaerae bacterium]